MSRFDPYRDKDLWTRAVMKSALRHAADRLESENCRKTPEVFLQWCIELSNHLYAHYSAEEVFGNKDGE